MGKFRIKISSSWFSKDYVKLKYTTNGIFWKTIKCCDRDLLDNRCYMITKTVHFSNVKEVLSRFKTIDDVISFEQKEREKVIKHNREISCMNKKHKEKRNEVYKKYS